MNGYLHTLTHAQPTAHSVSLKDGIDTHLLSRGEGTTFEIDVSQSLPNVEEEEAFDKEEVYKHLNSNCVGVEGDSASDSEDAMVSRKIASCSSWALSPGTEVHREVRIIHTKIPQLLFFYIQPVTFFLIASN